MRNSENFLGVRVWMLDEYNSHTHISTPTLFFVLLSLAHPHSNRMSDNSITVYTRQPLSQTYSKVISICYRAKLKV